MIGGVGHAALERATVVVTSGGALDVLSGLVYNRLELVVSLEKIVHTHLTKLVRLDEDHFGDGSCLLAVLICLDVLSELRHNCAKLQVELAQVAIGLQLSAQLVVCLLLQVG